MSDVIIAKKFSAVYNEYEDRLRLIINVTCPTRYDFWITRKFLIEIVDNLQNYLINFKEKIKKDSQNTQSSNKNEEIKLYPPQNTPSLLESVNIQRQNDLFILTLKDKKTTIEATLKLNELKDLLEMLIRPVKMRWGIGF